ncbi:hypothetical protein [Leptothoe sp. PORK10 BA2]|jgi:TolA-binding protein|uniref:hypothetical protein n=1 Tax=Leptothoe sp. PORK10 BA2 TaxID=3110254 RepID=UPI002B2032C0|nr:hypothetical protein [Leptothoe sp. PORK10 BA2]MEA5464652.1 hypothetical protein [Leptothoe sp. PORK10 BA2]
MKAYKFFVIVPILLTLTSACRNADTSTIEQKIVQLENQISELNEKIDQLELLESQIVKIDDQIVNLNEKKERLDELETEVAKHGKIILRLDKDTPFYIVQNDGNLEACVKDMLQWDGMTPDDSAKATELCKGNAEGVYGYFG